MLEWIIENKEWIFSGAGVAIITFLITLVLRKYRVHPKQQTQTTSPGGVSVQIGDKGTINVMTILDSGKVKSATNELIELLEIRIKKVNQAIKELKDKLNDDLKHWYDNYSHQEVTKSLIKRTIEVEDKFNYLSKKLLQALAEGKIVLAHEVVGEIHQMGMELSKQEEEYKEIAMIMSSVALHTYDGIVEFTMETLPRVINGFLDGIELNEPNKAV